MHGVDDYQLPENILGPHPNEFYGTIGRIVCVCAVLEDQATTLRHTLARAPQGQHTHEPLNQQLKAARKLAEVLPDGDHSAITDFLDGIETAFSFRNDIVHSMFPAQRDGSVYGHRPIRDKTVTDGTAAHIRTTIPELQSYIGQVSKLIRSFNSVNARATADASNA